MRRSKRVKVTIPNKTTIKSFFDELDTPPPPFAKGALGKQFISEILKSHYHSMESRAFARGVNIVKGGMVLYTNVDSSRKYVDELNVTCGTIRYEIPTYLLGSVREIVDNEEMFIDLFVWRTGCMHFEGRAKSRQMDGCHVVLSV